MIMNSKYESQLSNNIYNFYKKEIESNILPGKSVEKRNVDIHLSRTRNNELSTMDFNPNLGWLFRGLF